MSVTLTAKAVALILLFTTATAIASPAPSEREQIPAADCGDGFTAMNRPGFVGGSNF